LALPGTDKLEDRPRSPQGALRQEADPREVKAEGALGDLLFIQPAQAVLAELLVADLVGSAWVVVSQLADSGEITLWGLESEPPPRQVFAHTASAWGHGDPPVRVEQHPSHRVYSHRKIREPSERRTKRRKTACRWDTSAAYRVAG